MDLRKLKKLTIWLIIGFVLMPVLPVRANAGPPPTDIWMSFEYEISPTPTLLGFQLVGCEFPDCEQPVLLEQYGHCDAIECLTGERELYHVQDPECLDDICIMNLYADDYEGTALKLVGQFSDGVRESVIFADKLNLGSYAWTVAVGDSDLMVSDAEDFEYPYANFSNFFGYYAFTIVVELIVAAVLYLVWHKLKNADLARGLLYILLVNIVSYPVTWFFWPALAKFQLEGNRTFGYGITVTAILYAVYLIITSFTRDKARRIMMIIALGLLPFAFMIIMMVALVSFYGNHTVAVQGIPFGLTILLAEIFAFVFETVLVFLLARKPLSLKWWQAAIISLVMNAVSYGLGLVVFGGML